MKTLCDLFRLFARRNKKVAFVYRTGVRRFVFSYRDLHRLSMKMAGLLEERGVKKGDRVLLWAPNSPWWGIVFWGVISRGAIVVPVDFMSGKERAETIAKLTEAKLIIQSQYKLERIAAENSILIEELEYLLNDVEPAGKMAEAHPDDIAEIIYTSGSTGDPKGVVLTHKNLIANLVQINRHISVITSAWRFLSLLPLSHMLEQMGGFLIPLYHGGTIVYLRTLKPSAMMEALDKDDTYAVVTVPRLLQALKNSIERELAHKHLGGVSAWLMRKTVRFSKTTKKKIFFPIQRKFGKHFTLFVSGGAPLDEEVWRFWQALGFNVLEGYGLTECSPVLSLTTMEKQVVGSAGQALPDVQLKIENGETLAKGDNVFSGYYRNDSATKEAFTSDGWFQTGDLGVFDAEGNLFIKGRRKEMIVTGAGVNVFPEDVERVLNVLEGVRESCVIGVNSGEGEEVYAVLILDVARTPEEIIQKANEKLDPQQQITGFSLWNEPEFPKTTTLKIRRFQVRDRIAQGPKSNTPHTEDKLTYLISKVTGKPVAEIQDSSLLVADLGLTSIARLELVSFIEQEFRLDLEDTFITQKTTVGDLRFFIEKREKHKTSHNLRLWTAGKGATIVRKIFDALVQIPLSRIFFIFEIRGIENFQDVANKTPVLFIANHISYFDHPAIYYSLPPLLRYRTATAVWEEFFFKDTNPLKRFWKRFAYEYGTLFFNFFTLPQESGFRKTLEHMGKLIDRGNNILIFPEGERSRDAMLLPFQQGLGLMVKELKVPVIPIKIFGIEHIFPVGATFPKRGNVTIRFGKPLIFKKESPSEIVEKSRQAIIDLS